MGRSYTDGKDEQELIGNIGFGQPVTLDKSAEKGFLLQEKVLILENLSRNMRGNSTHPY